MKKFIIVASAVALVASQAHAQSLKDLLSGSSLKDVVEEVVSQLDILPTDITGTWTYSGSAVKFTSESLVMSATSELASSQVESKLNEYLEMVGFSEGMFTYVFNEDGSFTTTFKNLDFSGTYTLSDDTIEFEYGGSDKLSGFKVSTSVSVGVSTLQLLFDADALLEFVEKISASSSNSTLSSISSLLSQYDGMKLGFKLTR